MFKAEIENFKQYWPAHLFIHGPWGAFAGFLIAQYSDWGLGPTLFGATMLILSMDRQWGEFAKRHDTIGIDKAWINGAALLGGITGLFVI